MKISEVLTEGKNVLKDNNYKLKIIAKKCPVAVDHFLNNKIIYRGSPKFKSYAKNNVPILGDSSKMERKSANTYNYYTLWFDNHPTWKKFPKRSKSWICTTKYSYSTNYGYPSFVFPIGNPTVGICPSNDIWSSFRPCLETFTEDLKSKRVSEQSYEKMVKDIKDIYASEDFWDKNDLFVYGKTFEKFVQWLSPKRFETNSLSSMHFYSNREIWFSGPAFFVPFYPQEKGKVQKKLKTLFMEI